MDTFRANIVKTSGFDVYKEYIGLKLHFKSSNYDYSTYGKVNAKIESYNKRNDRYWFERLAAKYKPSEIKNFFIANFLADDTLWSKDLVNEECEIMYSEWIKRTEGIRHTFYVDCCNIRNYLEKHDKTFNELFVAKDPGNVPLICKLLLQEYITPETYCIFDILLNFVSMFDKVYNENIVWSSKMIKYNRYKYLMSHSKQDIDYFRKTSSEILS